MGQIRVMDILNFHRHEDVMVDIILRCILFLYNEIFIQIYHQNSLTWLIYLEKETA